MRRGGFTLIEALAAIVILGLIAPVSMVALRDAGAARSESVQLTRASWLASAVMETVLADVASEEETLGFAALEDAEAYLNTPITGLAARFSGTTSFYEKLGFAWSLSVGGLVSASGGATGRADEDLYRVVTVTVRWVGAWRGTKEFAVSAMVADLGG